MAKFKMRSVTRIHSDGDAKIDPKTGKKHQRYNTNLRCDDCGAYFEYHTGHDDASSAFQCECERAERR